MPNTSIPTLSTLDGTTGFKLSGFSGGDNAGFSVSSAGDFNGDGFDDFLVSAPDAPGDVAHAGATYLVWGKASGFGGSFTPALLDGSNGFQLLGGTDGDRLGQSVSRAGDLNGDGFDDLILGASGVPGTAAGAAYVVFGWLAGFGATLSLAAMTQVVGFGLTGAAGGDNAGYSVGDAGDVNGDGFGDLLVGAPGASVGALSDAGASYVVFGRSAPFDLTASLSTLDGSNGFRLSGAAANALSGSSVGSAGDVNGDGYDDLVIGAPGATAGTMANAGVSYVVFGKAGGFAADLDLSTLDGSNGFQLLGVAAGDAGGTAVGSAGDINGDGYDDLVVGAPSGSAGLGAAYVVFGKASGFAATLSLAALTGANGFKLAGAAAGDLAGRSVSRAGDINGDGLDDLLIGAPQNDANGSGAGAAYVLFGSTAGFAATVDVSTLSGSSGFQLSGVDGSDLAGGSVSDAGDVNGDGFADLLVGARAADGAANSAGAA